MIALTQVKRELRRGIVRARKRGLQIQREMFGVVINPSGRIVAGQARACCALSAWALSKRVTAGYAPTTGSRSAPMVEHAIGALVSKWFGWGTGAYFTFLHAFDGHTRPEERLAYPDIAALAERLAREFATPQHKKRAPRRRRAS